MGSASGGIVVGRSQLLVDVYLDGVDTLILRRFRIAWNDVVKESREFRRSQAQTNTTRELLGKSSSSYVQRIASKASRGNAGRNPNAPHSTEMKLELNPASYAW